MIPPSRTRSTSVFRVARSRSFRTVLGREASPTNARVDGVVARIRAFVARGAGMCGAHNSRRSRVP
jgi:hypothetical protein